MACSGIVIQNNATGIATNRFYDVDGTLASDRTVDADSNELAFVNLDDTTFQGLGTIDEDFLITNFGTISFIGIAAGGSVSATVSTNSVVVEDDNVNINSADEVIISAPSVEIGVSSGGDLILNAYPNTRDDSATVVNVLGTDAVGEVVSIPIADVASAVLPAIQRGTVALASAAADTTVVFGTPFANASYGLFITMRNTVTSSPATIVTIVTDKQDSDFTVEFSGPTPDANYVLEWFAYP